MKGGNGNVSSPQVNAFPAGKGGGKKMPKTGVYKASGGKTR